MGRLETDRDGLIDLTHRSSDGTLMDDGGSCLARKVCGAKALQVLFQKFEWIAETAQRVTTKTSQLRCLQGTFALLVRADTHKPQARQHHKLEAWSYFAETITYRQTSLNGSGLIAVYLTVFVIEACPRKCWRRLVSIPLRANAYPVEWRSM
jgi:hypothetical protein